MLVIVVSSLLLSVSAFLWSCSEVSVCVCVFIVRLGAEVVNRSASRASENHGHPFGRMPTPELKRRSGIKKTRVRLRAANKVAGRSERGVGFRTLA